MTDITPDFNLCLKEKGAQLVVKKEYDIEAINSFLQEAYNIVCPTTHPLSTFLTTPPELPNSGPHPRTPLNPPRLPLRRPTLP